MSEGGWKKKKNVKHRNRTGMGHEFLDYSAALLRTTGTNLHGKLKVIDGQLR
ncbi:hypothetical protein DSL72_004967 [Monilinia vaccinii-corymbosi]|uniref:Uncharacterized protein n=1 Tax=Monilinia vaccinii-corymbosi TaxID=61207 RepID=A0A8A3P3E9_9HELO|nr:hypothetical protein DSL72_004967 [Monilinia vaccinii-corymbosi]